MVVIKILIVSSIAARIFAGEYRSGPCYRELGCFPGTFPWVSALRPFPEPEDPRKIDTKIYLYTTKKPKERFEVTLWKSISIEHSDFDPNRPYTVFITHGFASSGNESWVENLKDAYIQRRDANVFTVDWGNGASSRNYLQVASNIRVVGAELKRFGQYLVDVKGLAPAKIHLVGHSLGAHISAYMAKGVTGVGHITGLDPAKPGFENCPDEIRLTKNDATFVDVLHTNTKSIKPLIAFGLMTPAGDNDYYVNDGLPQPGCNLLAIAQVELNATLELGKYAIEVVSNWVSCSHGRSYEYYAESLSNDECMFWGTSACLPSEIFDIHSLGKYFKRILQWLSRCKLHNCSPVGLEAEEYPARGVFIVPTNPRSPFCKGDSKTTSMMEKHLALKQDEESGVSNKNGSRLKKFVAKIFNKNEGQPN